MNFCNRGITLRIPQCNIIGRLQISKEHSLISLTVYFDRDRSVPISKIRKISVRAERHRLPRRSARICCFQHPSIRCIFYWWFEYKFIRYILDLQNEIVLFDSHRFVITCPIGTELFTPTMCYGMLYRLKWMFRILVNDTMLPEDWQRTLND